MVVLGTNNLITYTYIDNRGFSHYSSLNVTTERFPAMRYIVGSIMVQITYTVWGI